MASNATELMRLMVIRSPELEEEKPAVLLTPSDDVMRAPRDYQRAREFLAKMVAETDRRIINPASVPDAERLVRLRREAFNAQPDPPSPEAFVQEIFGKPAGEVIAAAHWDAGLRKLSDNLLFYKLAYTKGPRPLAELADLHRAMVVVARIAAGEITDMGGVRRTLDAPLRLPSPFARNGEDPEVRRMEVRREKAVEAALARVRTAIELHGEEQSIQKVLDELTKVPIDNSNFAVVDVASLAAGESKPGAPATAGTPQGGGRANEDSLAVNWALRRETLASRAGSFAPPASTTGLSLTPAAVRGLSAATRKALSDAGLDPARHSIEQIATALQGRRDRVRAERDAAVATSAGQQVRTIGGISVSRTVGTKGGSGKPPIPIPGNLKIPSDVAIDWDELLLDAGWPGDAPGTGGEPEADLGPSLMLPAGKGQLYVIRQQIVGYRSGEISHVENVLPGETRERQHRRLRNREVTTTQEYEREQEDEKSLQSTNRAELEREVQSTIKRKFDAGASAQVSGDYGKVEFTALAQVQTGTETEAANKTAQRVASEVIEISRQRVTERVRTERSERTLEEIEETNSHKFSGEKLTEPLVGVYQWIDKVYLNEVWCYGERTMYEVIVPEPASALIAAAMTAGAPEPTLVEKPPPLTVPIAQLDPKNVHALCVTYGVTEVIEQFPEPVLINVAFSQSSDKDAHDNFYAETKDIEVPDGYEPVDGWIVVRARGEDQTPKVGVTIGQVSRGFHTDNLVTDVEASTVHHNTPIYFTCTSWPDSANVEKLQAAIAVDDYSAFAASVMIQARPSAGRIDKWRRAAFAAIRSAYERRLGEWRDYQSQVDFQKPELSAKLLAANPAANREIVRHELQRAAIEIFRNLSLDLDLIREGSNANVPRIDFPALAEASPEILFLSQSFEWHNMTFVLYPYFFGRRPEWPMKMLLAGVDSNFVEFLKSGAARVQVPVRPGYEKAVEHYMMTREPFLGEGMPYMTDELYLPYIEEARDAAGAGLGGKHVVELDFEVTVPTTLVVARNREKIDVEGGTLPRWIKTGEKWEEA